ncbi:glycoside hydrolase [Ophiobolus disseminans]|uniref:chitinase n=1 Tax=Ophiobolus disseminans TaxID=1469910 RepID=A0A6A6ZPV4_9PLEO|nr:glycoside hydrolase [Ophiobolus disseminans]
MRFSLAALVAPVLLAASATARFVIYADEWHPTRPTSPEDRAGVDHVVLAFAMANATFAYQPKVPISTFKSEFPNAKIMIAVGGWGDDIGFFQVSKSDATIQQFAAGVATMLTNTGADGVDIDWEYPGGNGADYKQVPNSEKIYQIEAFPKLLAATRTAIGNKLLSIAVPGKQGDMMAFTKENGAKIWTSVDYINIMSYDLMNRRDNVTKHHSSVTDSHQTIKNYLAIGAPPEKINLGFAYYAKYFTTQGDCTAKPLGCPIVLAEDPVTGKDLLTSGAYTFEKSHMTPVDPASLKPSFDGTCGPEKLTKCATGCCSQYGNCGTSPEHCSGACQHAFGTGCTDPDVAGSWQEAAKNGVVDDVAGGKYYFDAENKLFWTWDTPELITRKFNDIVKKEKLGGVMAWSLGEDSFDWSHVKQMGAEIKKIGNAIYGGGGGGEKEAGPVHGEAPEVEDTGIESEPETEPKTDADTDTPYDVVWVDGTADGPEGDGSTEPDPSSSSDGPGPENQEVQPGQEQAAPVIAPESSPISSSDDLPFSPEYEAALRAVGALDKDGTALARGRRCQLKRRVKVAGL